MVPRRLTLTRAAMCGPSYPVSDNPMRSVFLFHAYGRFGPQGQHGKAPIAVEASSQDAAYSCAVRHAFLADPFARIGDPVAISRPGRPLPFAVDCMMIAD